MKRYIINDVITDGYERFAVIHDSVGDIELNVHFLEYDEFLENNEESSRKKKGDEIEGELSIELVSFSKKTDEELRHEQKIRKSSYIEAVIEVEQVIDEYSLYANSSVLEERILIEFESLMDYQVGDRVLIRGSLEMNEK